VIELETRYGPARVHLDAPPHSRAALVLGHGAGGGVAARDLQAAAATAREHGVATGLVEQPYRVAGRRSPPPAHHLDDAWTEIVAQLRAGPLAAVPLIAGGRSSGARVACRTAQRTDAAAVLCLAFPLRPPARVGAPLRPSRIHELEAVTVPVLVVQGESDPFGVPSAGPGREVVTLRGNHSLTSDLPGLRTAIAAWLARVLPAGR
jgi:predicted alpha/beta-hydrolase family hydrolase